MIVFKHGVEPILKHPVNMPPGDACTLGIIGTSKMERNGSANQVNFKTNIFIAYRKTSNIWRTLVGNKIVDHSDVIGASPVGAAPTTSSFST